MVAPVGLRCNGILQELRNLLPQLARRIRDFIPSSSLSSPSKLTYPKRQVKWVTLEEQENLRWENLRRQLEQLDKKTPPSKIE